MKFYHVLFLLLVGGLIFVVNKTESPMIKQAQEAFPSLEQLSKNSYRVRLFIEEENDKAVADILWFQMAAKVALKKKTPWFNVLEQTIKDNSVEGVIQLENDPMKAEYDANEILSLQLSDEIE